jgi:hypothetical protein
MIAWLETPTPSTKRSSETWATDASAAAIVGTLRGAERDDRGADPDPTGGKRGGGREMSASGSEASEIQIVEPVLLGPRRQRRLIEDAQVCGGVDAEADVVVEG